MTTAAHFYSVTAQQGTAVTHSVVGNFTRPDHTNLLVSRSTRLEIFTLTPEGIVGTASVSLYGRISVLLLFRPPSMKQDLAFVCTERYNSFVLGWDTAAGEPVTVAHGDMRDRVGKPVEVGHIGIVDPSSRVIALHLYDGFLKLLSLSERGEIVDVYSPRLEELRVIDVQFLHRCDRPTVAVLYADAKDARHVKTYEYWGEAHDLRKGAFQLPNIEAGSGLVIPVALGGGVIVGEQTVTYSRMLPDSRPLTVPIPGAPLVFRAFGRVDRTRVLLGDHLGRLHMLSLLLDERAERVADIRLTLLGETSIASSLSYLDSGAVFVGSSLGDSQIIRIESDGRRIEVLETFQNTGPISDLVVVDLDHRGQGQVVACSGGFKDGALSVIRNGVGVTEISAVDAKGAQGLWSLRTDSGNGRFLVLSFDAIGTQLLELREASLGVSRIEGFSEKELTLHCGHTPAMTRVVQVVKSGVRLIDTSSRRAGVIASWTPPGTATVKVVSCGEGCRHILLSIGQQLIYLEATIDHASGEVTGFTELGRRELDAEIACIDVGSTAANNPSARPRLCAVGCWDMNIHLMLLPDLRVVCTEKLEGDAVPHSLLIAELDATAAPGSPLHLLCGTGDGQMFGFGVAPGAAAAVELQDRKKYSLGTGHVRLRAVRTRGKTHVFAASNRPAVIYSPTGLLPSSGLMRKLLTSNVNLRELSDICAFPMQEGDEEGLALLTEGRLVLGIVDEIQKLHVRKWPQHEMPRRIAFQEETRLFAVLSVRTTVGDNGIETESCRVRLYDEQLAEVRAEFPLEPNETGCALASVHFADDPEPYFVVGTARIMPMEPEPTAGRIIVLRVADGAFEAVAEKDVKGAVYSIDIIAGKLLASVNSKVHIFTWSESQQVSVTATATAAAAAAAAPAAANKYTRSLIAHCEHQGHILALKVAAIGQDLIAVGDLMKSVSLLMYKPGEQRIDDIARDYEPGWVSSICPVTDDTILVAENSFNLYSLMRNSEATTDEDKARLLLAGEFHLGEFVNVFRRGSLVMRSQQDSMSPEQQQQMFIWGSASGAIGVLARITPEQYAFLFALQDALNKVITGVGAISHEFWRSFSSERKTEQAHNFIDGDLIESFLDLKPSKMAEVVAKIAGYKVSVEDVCKRIEALQRSTH